MLNIQLNGENICNPLEGQMDNLINTFVAVHGEDKREQITENLNGATFLFLPRMFDDLQSVREGLYNLRYNLSSDFFGRIGCSMLAGKMTVDSFFALKEKFESGDFDLDTVRSLEQVCKAILMYDKLESYRTIHRGLWGKKQRIGFNFEDGEDGFEFEDKEDGMEFVECKEVNIALKKLFQTAERVNNVYGFCDKDRKWLDEYSVIAKCFDALKDNDKKIVEKYDLKISRIFEAKVASLLGISEDEFERKYTFQQQNSLIFAYRSMINRGRENFADEMTITMDTKSRYIDLFLEMGVYGYGSDLKKFAEDEQLMDSIFDEKVFSQIEELEQMCENERANRNPFFVDAVKMIKSLDIKGGDMPLVSQVHKYIMHNKQVNAMVIHYITNDNQLRTICMLPLATHLNRDTLSHECEHIVESTIAMDGDDIWIKCGFEAHPFKECEESFDGTNLRSVDDSEMAGNRDPREYEVLNETFTQMFAYLVSAEAEKNGLFVGNPETANSWHLKMSKLFFPFYSFTKELSDVRMSNDKKAFEKRFGQVNTLLMNEIAKEYYELLKHDILYRSFVSSMRSTTGKDIEDINFLNLPEGVDFSACNAEFIKHHTNLAQVAKKMKGEAKKKNKQGSSDSEFVNE